METKAIQLLRLRARMGFDLTDDERATLRAADDEKRLRASWSTLSPEGRIVGRRVAERLGILAELDALDDAAAKRNRASVAGTIESKKKLG